MEKSLSSGLQDYIETIYVSFVNREVLKAADLARKLKISRASVSEALARLISKGLVRYDEYKNIYLTRLGKSEAKKVYEKHHILKDFFENVLGVPQAEASENACKIEHIISGNILDKMDRFSKFFSVHKKILDIYIEESEKTCPR